MLKKMPCRTFIVREVSAWLQGTGQLLLGANAADDVMSKLMLIYNPKNPRTLKKDTKSTLTVLYK
jgi:hypothetical protein